MNLQYITDSDGLTTGVFIPIKEWDDLKTKLTEVDQADLEIPEWHKEIVNKRMEFYKSNPSIALDFDSVMNDIEKSL
jgi:hypothetical protein